MLNDVESAPMFFMVLTEGIIEPADTDGVIVVRKCWRIRECRTEFRNDCLLVRVEPPLPCGNLLQDTVVLVARWEGHSVLSTLEDRLEVFVVQVPPDVGDRSFFHSDELVIIAWAVLFRSENAAQQLARYTPRER